MRKRATQFVCVFLCFCLIPSFSLLAVSCVILFSLFIASFRWHLSSIMCLSLQRHELVSHSQKPLFNRQWSRSILCSYFIFPFFYFFSLHAIMNCCCLGIFVCMLHFNTPIIGWPMKMREMLLNNHYVNYSFASFSSHKQIHSKMCL